MLRLAIGLVRIPDVSFVSWDRLPDGKCRANRFPDLAPDLAVEVLSASNTRKEMDEKLRNYFNGRSTPRLVRGPTRSNRDGLYESAASRRAARKRHA